MKVHLKTRIRPAWKARLGAFAAICSLASMTPAHFAQDAPVQAEEVLKITSGLVNLYTVVRDKNRPVAGLNRDDFELTEDNKPQEIRFFSRETDTPLTLGILIDTSASQEHVLGVEQRELRFGGGCERVAAAHRAGSSRSVCERPSRTIGWVRPSAQSSIRSS